MTVARRSSKRTAKRPQAAAIDQNPEQESPTKKPRSNKQKKNSTPTKSKSKKNIPKKQEVINTEEQANNETTSTNAALVTIPVDDYFPQKSTVEVVDDFDATLNRTDITESRNKNKYYRIQMLRGTSDNGMYRVFTRWGRVGEVHQCNTQTLGPFGKFEKAEKAFEKKFRDKTKNNWKDRATFAHVNGKYDLVERDYTKQPEDYVDVPPHSAPKKSNVQYLPSKLDNKTKELIDMLFEKDMYEQAMADYDFDIRRMPLGQLSSAQVQRGIEVLAEIDRILKHCGPRSQLPTLTSRFYSVLPHDFGRRRPPTIGSVEMLQKAFDKCNMLLDIEKANQLMEHAEQRGEARLEKHPMDALYDSLCADLTLVDRNSAEFQCVRDAFESTAQYAHTRLLDVWFVNRNGEADRFAPFLGDANKKCLWHGTNIAVVAAILSSGLRIMPHSGGRVGRGIYLASECGKSQMYTSPSYSRNIGCMFLAEAALGKEFDLLHDDPSLVKAPSGFDSVVARGHQTPAKFEEISSDGNGTLLPTGQPKPMWQYSGSSFSQDEYLVYREEQVRLRYIITVDYGKGYY